jgi:hypothetical protein
MPCHSRAGGNPSCCDKVLLKEYKINNKQQSTEEKIKTAISCLFRITYKYELRVNSLTALPFWGTFVPVRKRPDDFLALATAVANVLTAFWGLQPRLQTSRRLFGACNRGCKRPGDFLGLATAVANVLTTFWGLQPRLQTS